MPGTVTVHVRCNKCGADFPESDRYSFGQPVVGARCTQHPEDPEDLQSPYCNGVLEEIED
jgi:hypothetical protein